MKIRMHYALTVLILSAILSGCGAKGKGVDSPSPASSSPVPSESASASPTEIPSESPNVTILQQFKEQALAGTPADELYASFKQKMGEEVQPVDADELVRVLETYYDSHLEAAAKKYEADNVQQTLSALEWPISEEIASGIKDDSIRQLVQETLAGGYKLETSEGFIFPIVDYGQLLSFEDRVSIPMKTYLDLMATESDNASAEDGGLIISWNELASRTLASESYVVNFPDSPERSKVEDRFINYLTMYLIGLDNTPIFDYETFVLLPDVKKQYEQMVASHSGTVTGQLVKQLLDILGKSGDAVFIKNKNGEQTDIPAVKQFRDQIKSVALSKLPAKKNK
jgi:hypothetical protein